MNEKIKLGLILSVMLLGLFGIAGASTVQGTVTASQDVSASCVLGLSANAFTLGGNVISNVIITNNGNSATSVSISATDWTGPTTFSSSYTKWSTTGSGFVAMPSAGTPVQAYASIGVSGTGEIYFEASAPANAVAGSYQQTITVLSGC